MRAHFIRPVTDAEGDLIPDIQVTVFDPGTTDPVSAVLYGSDTGSDVLSNPFTASTGIIDFYLDSPARVRLGVVQGTNPIQYYDDVDVLAAGADSQHIGGGTNSLVIGISAVSAGDSSVALGPSASSAGINAVALGSSANATGDSSVALGQASATQTTSGVAVGYTASSTGQAATSLGHATSATGVSSTALGDGAEALYDNSTAIGAGAHTSGTHQIMMGTGSDFVEIPPGSGIVMTSPGGTRYKLTINDDGSVQTDAV